jgi:hypothetical protein
MLTDTMEKSKNPIKRAMRRRNAKQVTFTEPTFVEPSDYGYSSEEEDEDGNPFVNGDSTDEQNANGGSRIDDDEDEIATVQPLNIKSAANDQQPGSPEKEPPDELDDDDGRYGLDKPRPSDDSDRGEFLEFSACASSHAFAVGSGRSRNGTVRNTDSFFKDDTVETRKITLTPNLLRDDTIINGRASEYIKERGPSFDSIERTDRAKEDKKKKEKKGMLSGLFKRKDKKGRSSDSEILSGSAKSSADLSRESPGGNSEESSPIEKGPMWSDAGPQRRPSKGKLQKVSPTSASPRGPLSPTGQQSDDRTLQNVQSSISDDSLRDITNLGTVRDTSPDKGRPTIATRNALDATSPTSPQLSNKTAGYPPSTSAEPADRLSESPVHIYAADAEPPALVRDSSSDDDVRSLQDSPSPIVGTANGADLLDPTHAVGGHAHSPVSPVSPIAANSHALSSLKPVPPAPTRTPPPQPPGSSSPLPPLGMDGPVIGAARTNSTSTTTSAPSTPVWSDASLRAYLDESGVSDIRDLLLLTRDTAGVVPVSPDHPIMAGLFVEERGKVKEMGATLDGLLGNWLERKTGKKV